MSDPVAQLRALADLAKLYEPEVERAVREELIDEMYFAYWAKWERDLDA